MQLASLLQKFLVVNCAIFIFVFEGVSNFLDKVPDVLWRDGELKLVRDPSINILLEEGEEGKVEPCAFGVKALNMKNSQLLYFRHILKGY